LRIVYIATASKYVTGVESRISLPFPLGTLYAPAYDVTGEIVLTQRSSRCGGNCQFSRLPCRHGSGWEGGVIIRRRRRGCEQRERAEQEREGGDEKGEAGAAAPGTRVRPGRGACRGSRSARAGRAPGAGHAAGPLGPIVQSGNRPVVKRAKHSLGECARCVKRGCVCIVLSPQPVRSHPGGPTGRRAGRYN